MQALSDGELERAMSCFRSLTEHQPNQPGPWLQLADALETADQLEEAEEAARRAVKVEPGLPLARLVLGKILHRRGDPSARGILEALTHEPMEAPLRAELYNLLAEHMRDAGEPRVAFEHYEMANACHRQSPAGRALRQEGEQALPYSRSWVEGWADALEGMDPRTWPTSERGAEADPIFLLGFPRSGTTLLGRILEAHPALEVLEEEPVGDAALSLLLGSSRYFDLAQRTPDELTRARAVYLASAERYRRHEGTRLVDKLPIHTVRLPVLAQLFPRARFIFALRDPRDACLSCFMQNFNMNPAMASFLDLEDTARYHHAAFRIRWWTEAHLAPRMHVVRYESLVSDMQAEVRPLLEFLELPWDDRVLEYRSSIQKRAVRTPSYRRVGRALDRKAVERWRAYPEAVERMAPWLEPNLQRLGYAAETSTPKARLSSEAR